MSLGLSFQRGGSAYGGVEDFYDLASGDEFVAFAAAACDLVAAGVEALFAAHAGFDGEGVAVVYCRDDAHEAVGFIELDEENAFAGAGEEVDLIGAAEED